MDQLLRQLRQLGIDPADPPAWTVIRERAGIATPQLALAALEQWVELLGYHHTLPVRLLEAACRADSGAEEFDRFCLGTRRLLNIPRPQPRSAAAGAILCLTFTAKFHLRRGYSNSVWRGLYAFYFGRPLVAGPALFDPEEFKEHLEWLAGTCEYDFAQQVNLLTCWLAACHTDDWESTLLLLNPFLGYHQRAIDHIGFRDCMAFWLRAVGACPHEPNPQEVLRVGGWVLETLEAQRAQVPPQQRPDFDDEQAWGFFTWAMAALVRCLTAPSPYREQVVAVHARYLEGFSARMALNAMARTSVSLSPVTVVDASAGLFCHLDTSPNTHEAGVSWRELHTKGRHSWETLFEPDATRSFDKLAAAYATLPVSTPVVSRPIPAELYDRLSHSFNSDQWSQRIPHGAAFLGGYELPHSGRPVIVLAYNTGDRVVWDVAAGDAPSAREMYSPGTAGHLSPLSAHGLREQDKCDQAWAVYERWQKEAGEKDPPQKALSRLAQTLCSALVGFHEKGLNLVYGPLIDAVVESVESQVGGEGTLVEADLVFCPRGPLNMAAPAMVGGRRKLARIFRSITVSPSLAIFSHLHERSASRAVPALPRLNVLSWYPENGSPSRRLIKRAVDELSPVTDLWLAAEQPIATLDRASQMTAAGDWNLLFAHGQAAPSGTGARLADGLFPVRLAPCAVPANGAGAGVLFLLSCLAGRLTQTPPYVDAFGSITEEAVLTFCLSDRLRRPPSLVGAFTHVVEAHVAVDLGIELIRRRLQRSCGGPAWAGFARVLNDLVSQVVSFDLEQPGSAEGKSFTRLLEGSPSDVGLIECVRLAAKNPMHFLGVYSSLNFRLTGCEPMLLPDK